MTSAADKSGIAQAPQHMRRELVAQDEHASILRSLVRVDWLVLLAVALYAVVAAHPPGRGVLYAAVAAYALVVMAFRWNGFPVKGPRRRIALGAAAMVAFITVVAARTGGTLSPLANLYLLPIVVVSMTLGRRGALAAVAAVLLAWAWLLAGEGTTPPAGELLTRMFGQLGPWALVAYVTQALAGSIITARRRIEEMVERDSLTGLLNLRTFKATLAREHALRARDGRGGYAILLVDMDDLKALNDEHGHQAGNRAIMAVASAIQRAIRATDMAARAGGDEFLVFLPQATPEVAEAVAQRIRNHAYRSLFPVGERLQRMTVSVGAGTWPRDGTHQDDVVAAAQQGARRDRELRRSAEPAPG